MQLIDKQTLIEYSLILSVAIIYICKEMLKFLIKTIKKNTQKIHFQLNRLKNRVSSRSVKREV
jgi:hypothetical protein